MINKKLEKIIVFIVIISMIILVSKMILLSNKQCASSNDCYCTVGKIFCQCDNLSIKCLNKIRKGYGGNTACNSVTSCYFQKDSVLGECVSELYGDVKCPNSQLKN